MPVPSLITDLSSTISLNSPQGSESAKGTVDDYLRAHAGFIKQINDALLGPSVTLPSASTVSIGFASSINITITGSVTISAFDTIAEGALRYITFTGAPTLVHNPVSMALPGAQNIAAGSADFAIFKSLGGGNWKCLTYMRASGAGPVKASNATDGYLSAADWAAFNGKQNAGAFYPKTGGQLDGSMFFPNNSGLYFKDAGGTLRQCLVMSSDDSLYLNLPGGQKMHFVSQNGSREILTLENNGTVSVGGPLVVDASPYNNGPMASFKNTGTNGVQIGLFGNGATTPNKYLRCINGNLDVVNSGNAAVIMTLTDAGVLSANVITETSDERKKTNWRALTDAQLDALAALDKVGVFDWIDGSGASVGGSAQQIRNIVPEAVHEDAEGNLSVQYMGLAFAMAHGALRRTPGRAKGSW